MPGADCYYDADCEGPFGRQLALAYIYPACMIGTSQSPQSILNDTNETIQHTTLYKYCLVSFWGFLRWWRQEVMGVCRSLMISVFLVFFKMLKFRTLLSSACQPAANFQPSACPGFKVSFTDWTAQGVYSEFVAGRCWLTKLAAWAIQTIYACRA